MLWSLSGQRRGVWARVLLAARLAYMTLGEQLQLCPSER